MKYIVLSEKEERIATAVVDAAYQVHRKLGAGLLESVYELCFCHELTKKGFIAKRQVPMEPIRGGRTAEYMVREHYPRGVKPNTRGKSPRKMSAVEAIH